MEMLAIAAILCHVCGPLFPIRQISTRDVIAVYIFIICVAS